MKGNDGALLVVLLLGLSGAAALGESGALSLDGTLSGAESNHQPPGTEAYFHYLFGGGKKRKCSLIMTFPHHVESSK